MSTEGKLRPCLPDKAMAIQPDAFPDWKLFESSFAEMSELKTTAQCFKCIPSWLGDATSSQSMGLICGRNHFDRKPEKMPLRIGPLAVPGWDALAEKCTLTSCDPLDVMDRVACLPCDATEPPLPQPP